MKYFIPTYSEARSYCVNEQFYFTTHWVEGYRIDLFNYNDYRVWYDEFLPNKKEMRGLAFIFNDNIHPDIEYPTEYLNDNVFNHSIALEKFWNVNQVSGTQFELLKDEPILSIYEKVDGSIINFIKLPNNKIVAKSKMSFASLQAIAATRIYNENTNIKKFVNSQLEINNSVTFEYVAPTNQVVLYYKEENLILLRVRDNKTGEYIDIDAFKGLSKAVNHTSEYRTLAELNVALKQLKGVEGYVVQLPTQMVKWKTDWYFDHHKLYTNNLNYENLLIEMILDNTIDDVCSQIQLDDAKQEQIKTIRFKLSLKITEIENIIIPIIKTFSGNFKEFAIEYRTHEYFPMIMQVVRNNSVIRDVVINRIKKDTKQQMNAIAFLNDIN